MRQTKLFCSPGSQLTQPKVDNLIVKFVVDGLHSLSTVEEPGFIQLVTGFRPGTSVMSRRSLGRRIDEEWEKFLDDAREKLSGQSYVATTADIWSTHHRSFMRVAVHWVVIFSSLLAVACAGHFGGGGGGGHFGGGGFGGGGFGGGGGGGFGGGGDDGGSVGVASVSYVKTPVVSVNYVAKPVVSYVAKPVATVSHAIKPVLTYTTVSHGGGGFGGGGFGGGGFGGGGYGGGGGHGGWW